SCAKWTASPWPSSWPRHGFVSCPPRKSPTGSMIICDCCVAVTGQILATRPSGRLWTGAMNSSPTGSVSCLPGCRSSRGASTWKPPRRCAPEVPSLPALAERYGWGTEPVIAPALMTLAGTMVLLGEFDEGERWLRRTRQALQTDTGPDITLLLHQTAGMLHAGRGRRREALEEFGAAEHLGSQLEGSQALASQVTGWLLATQARLGMTGEARAMLAALDDERASSGEIRNALAVICLSEGNPAAALAAAADVLDGTAPVQGYVTVMEAHLLAGLAHRELGDQRAASQAAERALALAESDRLVLPF